MKKGKKISKTQLEILEEKYIDLENRVQKIEGVFHLGSNILQTTYFPPIINNLDLEFIYKKAVKIVRKFDRASASLLQRRLSIGYAMAARLLDLLEERGVVGPADGAKPREVIPIKIKL